MISKAWASEHKCLLNKSNDFESLFHAFLFLLPGLPGAPMTKQTQKDFSA